MITVKYLGPTATRSARWVATDGKCRKIYSRNYTLDINDDVLRVVKQFYQDMQNKGYYENRRVTLCGAYCNPWKAYVFFEYSGLDQVVIDKR